ncbi:hypothetical protein [Brevibacterium album]|uniref:hypothetical protein n=1 Tax=Brevibacterium album TaxID=417948 RepID=UPI00048D35B3|nr:hypothetical protein [Brevibacterium album]
MRRKTTGLKRRHARRIRRGIVGAGLAYSHMKSGKEGLGVAIFYAVDSLGGLTREALYREFARLVVRDVL